MDELAFYRNYDEVFLAVERCLASDLITPALILIFTAIDSVGWLASSDPVPPVAKRFEAFVDKWMLKNYPLPSTAKELYLARCGLLHNLIPSSGPFDKTGVRELVLLSGSKRQATAEIKLKVDGQSEGFVAVHVGEILVSFRNGFGAFKDSLEINPEQKKLFDQRVGRHYHHLDDLT